MSHTNAITANCRVALKVFTFIFVSFYSSSSLLADDVFEDIDLPPGSHPKHSCAYPNHSPSYSPSPEEQERDNIYQLVAYGVVYKDWQTGTWGEENARGYNIGSILVDGIKPKGEGIVCWARNSVITTGNETQHVEVRLMTNYLANNKAISSLSNKGDKHNFKLYTTLEPCAMCGGMMTLQNLNATQYGQTDPDFGDGIQRLEVNSHVAGGFCPYPRGVYSNASTLALRQKIDQKYAKWKENNRGLTTWLTTVEARDLFAEAITELKNWEVKYQENTAVLAGAIKFLDESVPDSFAAIPYTQGCEGT